MILAVLVGALAAAGADRVVVGEVSPEVREMRSVSRADAETRLRRLVLVTRPRDPDGIARFLADVQDPASPLFHRWLSPNEFGERFGPRLADLRAIADFLSEEGFEVEELPEGRAAVVFSGTAAQVETTFGVRFELLAREGESLPHLASVVPPSVPACLARAVLGLLPLDDLHRKRPLLAALTTNGGVHTIAPADFATIYGCDSLATAGIDGTGQTIGIIGQTNLSLSDTRLFRQTFGLPPVDPKIVVNGDDPGNVGGGDRVESNVDIQWSGGVAPKATVLLVISKSTATSDGVDLSSLYAVDKNLADVVSLSYGDCEQHLPASVLALYHNVWAQAAAQGISVFVASGDSGAAGCEVSTAFVGTIAAVNGLSSSPYATCVGGTQLDDGPDPRAYWSDTNDPLTKKSVKGTVPEAVWNESRAVGGGGLNATGGGQSVSFDRPLWQSGAGVPDDGGKRLVPDVSLNAAGHTAYQFYDLGSLQTRYGGTSFSSPAFAGIAALLNQKRGGRQGNLNPRLYELGRAQYAGGRNAPVVFNDVTKGSNTVPGVVGFTAVAGFDAATGLGSVNAAALAGAWAPASPPSPDFEVAATPAILSISPGGAASVRVSLLSAAGADVTATLTVGILPDGVSATFAPANAANGKAGYVSSGFGATLTLSAASGAPAGSFPVGLGATANGRTRVLTLLVSVGSVVATPPSFSLQVPAVLDVFGVGGSHFTSDLVAVNRSAADTTVQLSYAPAPGTSGSGGPVFARTLAAGHQLHLPDVIAALRASGYTLDPVPAPKLGTLFLRFLGITDPALVYAGSRASTPNPNGDVGGSFGTFYSASPPGGICESVCFTYGLRESPAFRTNLALVHAPASPDAGPLGLEVQVFDGATGQPAGAPITVTLKPAEFRQLGSVLTLAQTGLSNGYARIRRTSGADRFIAYAVVNDGGAGGGGTSDGSFLPSGGTEGLVPIVLDVTGSTRFRTELVLTNPSSTTPGTARVTYTPSKSFSGAGGGSSNIPLGAGQQLVLGDAIAELRSRGIPIPTQGNQGGTLLVRGAFALARTFNPNPDSAVGGTFGVAYPASAATAIPGAWIYGLRQDESARSNLAIADARVGVDSTVEYAIEIYDGDTGGPAAKTLSVTLAGGDWTQIGSVLATAGIRNGYAHVVPRAGSSAFVAYGVVNDGASPGRGTSDGSYLPMVAER